MTSQAPQALPAPAPALLRADGARPALVIAALAFGPMLLIGLLGWWWASVLRPVVFIDLTNLAAVRQMLGNLFSPSTHGDSWLPMRAALEVLSGARWNTLYESLFFQDKVRFQYPPTSLVPLEALTVLGLSGVRTLNALNSMAITMNAIAMGGLAWALFQHRPAAAPTAYWPSPRVMAGLAVIASFTFYPVVRAHLLGQIQLWIDLLFTLAVLLWLVNRRLLAGVAIGLACAIKPQLGVLLLWALLWRERGFVAGMLLALAPICAVSLLRYGLHNHLAYLDVLSFLSRHGESFFANNSVNGVLNWYLSPQDSLTWQDKAFTPFNPLVYAGTLAASVFFYALIIAQPLLARRRVAGPADLSAAAICTIVASPVAWEHHYGLLLPMFLVGLRAVITLSSTKQRLIAAGVLFIAWTAVANFIPFASLLAHTGLAVIQAYCLSGALLLLGLLIWRAGSQDAGVA